MIWFLPTPTHGPMTISPLLSVVLVCFSLVSSMSLFVFSAWQLVCIPFHVSVHLHPTPIFFFLLGTLLGTLQIFRFQNPSLDFWFAKIICVVLYSRSEL